MKESYDQIIHAIYESATNPQHWVTTLESIRRHLNASSYNLWQFNEGATETSFRTQNLPDDFESLYRDYWIDKDLWVQEAMARNMAFAGSTMIGEMLVPQTELSRTPFFNEFLKKMGVRDMACACLWDNRPDTTPYLLSVFRDIRSKPFDEHANHELNQISSHLIRALNIAANMEFMAFEKFIQTTLLDHSKKAVFLLDQHFKIQQKNHAAEKLLENLEHPLVIRQGKIRSLGTRCFPTLECAKENSLTNRATTIAFETRATEGHYTKGKAILLSVSHSADGLSLSLSTAYILVVNPIERQGIASSLDTLKGLHHLTAAETRVLSLIAKGHSAREIAECTNVTEATVRSQIQQLRTKTGVRRISDLCLMVALLE